MSKSLILDWQKSSLMLAQAHGRSPKAVIDSIVIKPVGGAEVDSQTAAEALRSAAQELSVKGDVTVLLARELVELRTVQFPKIDPDDLPDVIRFQAQRQFANMTEAWTLDYVVLPPSAGSEMQTALVAAVSPAQLAEIESACTSAGLQASRIALRPLQMAQMAVDGGLISSSGQSMIVCVSDEVTDILVLRDGKVVQVRATKLPSEPDQVPSALQGEIRRSLLAVSSEMDGKPIDSVLFIATTERAAALSNIVQQTLPAKVVNFHPETLLPDRSSALAEVAACRLVAMAGSLTLPTTDKSSVIDFKNPKKRPPKKRDSRKYLLYGGAAAALAIAAVGWYYTTTSRLDDEYALLQQEVKAKKDSGDAAKKRLAELASIEKFAQDAPNWLDELVYISEKIPSSEKMMIESPSFSLKNGAGEIGFTVKSVDNDVSGLGALRDDHYDVNPKTTKGLPKPEGKYRYGTAATISISGKGWDLNAPGVKLPESENKSSTGSEESSRDSSSPSTSDSESKRPPSRRFGPGSGSGPGRGPGTPPESRGNSTESKSPEASETKPATPAGAESTESNSTQPNSTASKPIESASEVKPAVEPNPSKPNRSEPSTEPNAVESKATAPNSTEPTPSAPAIEPAKVETPVPAPSVTSQKTWPTR